jgi:hypothetical protein
MPDQPQQPPKPAPPKQTPPKNEAPRPPITDYASL